MSKKKAFGLMVVFALCLALVAQAAMVNVGWLLSRAGARDVFGRGNGFLGPTFGLIGYFAAPWALAQLGMTIGLPAGPVGAMIGFGVGAL